jgi:hypothetical protein
MEMQPEDDAAGAVGSDDDVGGFGRSVTYDQETRGSHRSKQRGGGEEILNGSNLSTQRFQRC